MTTYTDAKSAAKTAPPKTRSKTKTRKVKGKPKAKTVKLRKDGKPDGRSSRLKAIHAEARALSAVEPSKRGPGQPTKYRPEMCAQVMELGLDGRTRHQMAVELGIHYVSLLEYERLHPEFTKALKEAYNRSLSYWQGIVQEAIRGDRKVNGLALVFGTKNMFPDHFKDQTNTEVRVKHQFSEGFEDFLTGIAKDKRADQAKLIDARALEIED